MGWLKEAGSQCWQPSRIHELSGAQQQAQAPTPTRTVPGVADRDASLRPDERCPLQVVAARDVASKHSHWVLGGLV